MGNWLESNTSAAARAAVASRQRNLWMAGSAIAHGVLLVVLCWRPEAVFVKPRLLAKGQNGTATQASMPLYVPQNLAVSAPHDSLLSVPGPTRPERTRKSALRRRTNVLEHKQPADNREAGSALGSSSGGFEEGDEIKQGFAIAFAPPHVSRWELPGGREADVIVELSIDELGNVVEEKLLQGIGSGIDEKVLAAVRDWHFRPATRNGVAIPFKYDARFHFPS